jgi:hypothetical protein
VLVDLPLITHRVENAVDIQFCFWVLADDDRCAILEVFPRG